MWCLVGGRRPWHCWTVGLRRGQHRCHMAWYTCTSLCDCQVSSAMPSRCCWSSSHSCLLHSWWTVISHPCLWPMGPISDPSMLQASNNMTRSYSYANVPSGTARQYKPVSSRPKENCEVEARDVEWVIKNRIWTLAFQHKIYHYQEITPSMAVTTA